MHEFSMVQSLLDTIRRCASEQGAKEVTKVVLRIGPLSGVEPHLFRIAFDTFKEGSIAEKAELVINQQDMQLRCNDCKGISVVDGIVFKCQDCGSINVEVLDGEDMILERLEMECI